MIYRFSVIVIKIPMAFIRELGESIMISTWNLKEPQIAKKVFLKSWRFHTSNFQTYYKATVIQTVWCWHKNKRTDQWIRIKSPKINPHVYGQYIVSWSLVSVLNHSIGKGQFLQQMMLENQISTCKRMRLDSYLRLYTKS